MYVAPMFVFDNLHTLSDNELETIGRVLTDVIHYQLSGRSIIILITQQGSDEIRERYDELVGGPWEREQLTERMFHPTVQNAAYMSRDSAPPRQLIPSHLINYYVPFMPIDMKTAQHCFSADALRRLQMNPSPT